MFHTKFQRALALAIVFALGLPVATFADEVYNDIDATIDAAVESTTVAVGATKGVTLAVKETGTGSNPADGKSGCNLTGSTTLVTSVSSSATSKATVSPSSITWDGCGDTAVVTVTGVAVGSATISLAQTSNNTGATFDLAPATFSVQVTSSNTAPVVSVTGPADGATYEIGSVPTAGCSVTDAEDTNESATPDVGAIQGPLAAYGLGTQTVSCSYTDGGGLSDSDSVTYTIVDTGSPVITDQGPTATANGSNGWYTSAVTNSFQASDSGAGFLSPLTNPHNFTQSSGTAEGSAVKITSGTVSDVAGNTAASIDSAAFKIDLSNPYNVAFSSTLSGTYYFGFVPAAPTCTADDDISGLASCLVTGHETTVGTHTLTATATDHAGRTATTTASYTVAAWTLTGFYSPVDMNNALNVVKAGSTVPLKFEIFAGPTELTTTDKVGSFKVGRITCGAVDAAVTDDIEQYSTGQTSLRYDATGGQFIQNWQVPKTSAQAPVGTCYQVTLTTQDGSSATAFFKTK